MWLRKLLPFLLMAAAAHAQSINGIPSETYDSSHVNGVAGQSTTSTSINGVTGQTLPGGGGSVATPTFSVAAGAVAPGTAITISDATPNATIYYTWDNSTPTYDATTDLGTGTAHIFGVAGSGGLSAGATFQTAMKVYAPLTIKVMAAAPGLADSAVTSASYTLTVATGTALSACGNLTTAGVYYLTGNVSSSGTCFKIEANGITLNLNGNTVTYGTGGAPVASGANGVTNGTTAFTGSGFASGMVGDQILIDSYNQSGGYQTFAGTIAAYVSATQVTLSGVPSFSLSSVEYKVTPAASYGVQCNAQVTGQTCKNLEVYNGTLTETTAGLQSEGIQDGSPAQYGDNGGATFVGLTFNIAAVQGQAIVVNYTSGGDTIAWNTVNDGVTFIFDRDAQPYPFQMVGTNNGPATSPTVMIDDNICLNSPDGCIVTNFTGLILNNTDITGTIQYANSFGVFSNVANGTALGNTISGYTQGMELEVNNTTYEYNYINTQSSATVHDPNHNPDACDNNFGIRTKNFAATDIPITGGLLKNNFIETTNDACAGEGIEYSQLWTGDTDSISGNYIVLNMLAPQGGALNQSAIYGFNGGPPPNDGNAVGLTYSGNTFSFLGPDASQGEQVFVNWDQVNSLTLGGLSSPQIFWVQGPSGENTSMTLSGTGTATCNSSSNPGGSTLTLTYNGTAVSCP